LTYDICGEDAHSTQSKESESSVLGETHDVGQLSRKLRLLVRTLKGEEAGISSLCFDAIWLEIRRGG
jgi:hypothetical protein